MSRKRKISSGVLFAALLSINLLVFLPAMRASREIRRFCAELAPGTHLAEVRSRADARGYRFEEVVGGHRLVEHPNSMGRAYCDLGFDARGQLVSIKADN